MYLMSVAFILMYRVICLRSGIFGVILTIVNLFNMKQIDLSGILNLHSTMEQEVELSGLNGLFQHYNSVTSKTF